MPDIVVMFFVLGLVAGVVKSDLTIPKAAYDTLSLLLMLTIGLKGGIALYGNLNWELIIQFGAVMALGAAIPFILFPLLRGLIRLSPADSASLAAHYGSVSAGTFAVSLAYAEGLGLTVGPEVTLYLVLMELPAIIMGLWLYRQFGRDKVAISKIELWHETLTNRGVILLVGGVIIGALYGPVQGAAVTDLFNSAFKGVLALFLLEMGLVAAETFRPFPRDKWRAVVFALVAPTALSFTGLGVGLFFGLPDGSVVILAALAASASYIAAPVAVRGAIPNADIGLAMLCSLGITFPFNVMIGIPLYHQFAQWSGSSL